LTNLRMMGILLLRIYKEQSMSLRKQPSADIKSKTRRYFEISLLIALVIVISAFRFFPSLEKSKIAVKASEEIVKVEDIDNTKQDSRPPPPARPPIPIEAPSADAIDDIDISSEVDITKQQTAPLEPPKSEKKVEKEEEQYFEVVEDPPTIIGGMEALKKNLVYPDLAIRAGVEGTVIVLAYVDKSGNVTRAETIRAIGGGCDEAAVDAVKKTKFTPGMQRGKPVNVKVSVPVKFRLKN